MLLVKVSLVDEFRHAGKEICYGYIIGGFISVILDQIGVLIGMLVDFLISIR